jgi:hypothetical protein
VNTEKNPITVHKEAIAKLTELKGKLNLVHKKDEGLDINNLSLPEQLEKYCGITPRGYSIITRLVTVPQSSHDNPLGLTDEQHAEQVFRPCIGLVLAVAEDAYGDKERFPNGSWCKPGDFILFPSTSGYYIYYDSQPLYLIKEHAVDARIEPWAVSKISRKNG